MFRWTTQDIQNCTTGILQAFFVFFVLVQKKCCFPCFCTALSRFHPQYFNQVGVWTLLDQWNILILLLFSHLLFCVMTQFKPSLSCHMTTHMTLDYFVSRGIRAPLNDCKESRWKQALHHCAWQLEWGVHADVWFSPHMLLCKRPNVCILMLSVQRTLVQMSCVFLRWNFANPNRAAMFFLNRKRLQSFQTSHTGRVFF